jgi:hypothetical protein
VGVALLELVGGPSGDALTVKADDELRISGGDVDEVAAGQAGNGG